MTFEPKFSKLPVFGLDCISDFESPTFDELKRWPLDRQIKLCQIGIKRNGMNLSGIQLMFTNGVESPLFESDTSRDREMNTIDIDITQ